MLEVLHVAVPPPGRAITVPSARVAVLPLEHLLAQEPVESSLRVVDNRQEQLHVQVLLALLHVRVLLLYRALGLSPVRSRLPAQVVLPAPARQANVAATRARAPLAVARLPHQEGITVPAAPVRLSVRHRAAIVPARAAALTVASVPAARAAVLLIVEAVPTAVAAVHAAVEAPIAVAVPTAEAAVLAAVAVPSPAVAAAHVVAVPLAVVAEDANKMNGIT